jgi:hypothetical protein
MITAGVQRWRARRDTYRPAREAFDPRAYEVASIATDTEAKGFVLAHHYSGAYPVARYRFGLYDRAELAGVAVFSVPQQPRALACLPGEPCESVELGRFVLLDHVKANAESWFLARAFELLRVAGVVGVVSFSDPVPRSTADGAITFVGHVGTIYQATNAVYLGRSKAENRAMLADGRLASPRALSKIRRGARGEAYARRMLERYGAPSPRPGEDGAAWLARVMPQISRPLRHTGNHKYAWTLRRRDRRHLPESLAYPKFDRGVA